MCAMTCNIASFLPLPNSYWSCGIVGRIATTQHQMYFSFTTIVCVCMRLRWLCACASVWMCLCFVCMYVVYACVRTFTKHSSDILQISFTTVCVPIRSKCCKTPIKIKDRWGNVCCIILCLAAVNIYDMLVYL